MAWGGARMRPETSEGADALALLGRAARGRSAASGSRPRRCRKRWSWSVSAPVDLDAFAERRAQALLADHRRVREAAQARGSYAVKALLPPDVIGALRAATHGGLSAMPPRRTKRRRRDAARLRGARCRRRPALRRLARRRSAQLQAARSPRPTTGFQRASTFATKSAATGASRRRSGPTSRQRGRLGQGKRSVANDSSCHCCATSSVSRLLDAAAPVELAGRLYPIGHSRGGRTCAGCHRRRRRADSMRRHRALATADGGAAPSVSRRSISTRRTARCGASRPTASCSASCATTPA